MERGREREALIGHLLHTPTQDQNLQPGHVP